MQMVDTGTAPAGPCDVWYVWTVVCNVHRARFYWPTVYMH